MRARVVNTVDMVTGIAVERGREGVDGTTVEWQVLDYICVYSGLFGVTGTP